MFASRTITSIPLLHHFVDPVRRTASTIKHQVVQVVSSNSVQAQSSRKVFLANQVVVRIFASESWYAVFLARCEPRFYERFWCFGGGLAVGIRVNG